MHDYDLCSQFSNMCILNKRIDFDISFSFFLSSTVWTVDLVEMEVPLFPNSFPFSSSSSTSSFSFLVCGLHIYISVVFYG